VIIWWLLGAAWTAGLIGALTFLVLYGSPRKYVDRRFSWHLAWSAFASVLQFGGLLLSRWSLWPLVVADWLAVAILYWRVGLLVATRRSASRKVDHDLD
jgi:hypothetical protein